MTKLTADDLIYGYINGIFPMADADGFVRCNQAFLFIGYVIASAAKLF